MLNSFSHFHHQSANQFHILTGARSLDNLPHPRKTTQGQVCAVDYVMFEMAAQYPKMLQSCLLPYFYFTLPPLSTRWQCCQGSWLFHQQGPSTSQTLNPSTNDPQTQRFTQQVSEQFTTTVSTSLWVIQS